MPNRPAPAAYSIPINRQPRPTARQSLSDEREAQRRTMNQIAAKRRAQRQEAAAEFVRNQKALVEEARQRKARDVRYALMQLELNKTPTEAAMAVSGIQDIDKAKKLSRRLMGRPEVKKTIERYAQRAIHRVEELAEGARSEKVRLEANIDLLDRAGYGPPKDGGTTNNVLIVNIPEAIARKHGIEGTHVARIEGSASEASSNVT